MMMMEGMPPPRGFSSPMCAFWKSHTHILFRCVLCMLSGACLQIHVLGTILREKLTEKPVRVGIAPPFIEACIF